MSLYGMEKTRQYWADWMRVSIILTLIVYHTSLTFSALGSTYIYREIDSPTVIPFLLLTAPLDNFFMAALFFLAGYAAFFALKKRTASEFVQERDVRLMIPVGFVTALLIPFQVYFKYLQEGFTGNFGSFMKTYFPSGIWVYGWGHLWFLFYLFVFSMLCLPLFMYWKTHPGQLLKISAFMTKGVHFLIPLTFIATMDALLRPLFNTGRFILWGDWANDVLYLSFFILGYVFSSDERLQRKIFGWRLPALYIAIPCLLVILTLYYLDATERVQPYWHTWLWSSMKGIYECSMIVALTGFFHTYLNTETKAVRYLSKASFSYYLWHFLPVTGMTWFVLKSDWHPYLQFLGIVLPSYLFIFIVYELVNRRLFKTIRKVMHPWFTTSRQSS
ncbi:Acyltransferase family protein [Sphaerochaeta associata]|nr:Acyltransferase family protein [Sphaerochaeta associata]